MGRVLDPLGITRAEGSPRPEMFSAVIGGVGLFLVLTGGSVIAGDVETGSSAAIWIGGALIVVGLACRITMSTMGRSGRRRLSALSRLPIRFRTVRRPSSVRGRRRGRRRYRVAR